MKPSRRRFLQSALAAPLAATLGRPGPCAVEALVPATGQELFPNPHLIRYDASCFTINDRDAFIFSGAFHYPRCPRPLWRDRLTKFQRAGFNTIETHVFWNYHEPEEGRADLSEFEAFVELVREMGFWMIVRPGPYVGAEWDAGGFPHWVIARRLPLRSSHSESVRTSEHWFGLVLPVILRHQVTRGGPIIMVQIENEYDYAPPLPDTERREYIRALAQMAWGSGIDVPLITCWTKQARENSDPDMARIMDTCNFYPRWNIQHEVPPALAKLRQEEPKSPLGVTELQGGWFSEFGGKLSVEQEGVSAAQLSILSKTVIELGVTYFNYYMGFGGTNFDRAGKNVTTTYDYAAPIREPGGLWEKYYAARGIGASLGLVGNTLTRAKPTAGIVQSTNTDVSVSERESGKSGVLFIRGNSNAEQHYKMIFVDPNSPTRRLISAPREGELVIGAREIKMLPIQIPIAGGQLRYTTADVLAHGPFIDRQYLIVYDEPGRMVEIGLATRDEPHVEGDAAYQYWDPEYESVVIGLKMDKTEKTLLLNNHLLVVAVPRERALRSWTAEFPVSVVPGEEATKSMSIPFISEAALLAGSGFHLPAQKGMIWADFEFSPGEHDLTALLPPVPIRCRVNGALTDFHYDRHWRTTRVHFTTPALPYKSMPLNEVRIWVEKSGQFGGEMLTKPLGPLEELGTLPYGYIKYVYYPLSYTGQPNMFITTFADDAKKVFLNRKLVAEASNAKKQVEFALADYTQSGENAIEIFYELFGSPNFGENVGELKGIESVRIGRDTQSAAEINPWQIQRYPPGMRGREVEPDFSIGGWTPVELSGISAKKDLVPAFTWCRTEFALPEPPEDWSIAWKLTFEAARDTLVYLNGKFVGRYVTVGPQKDFYLPEPYLEFGAKRRNVLTLILAYADEPHAIRTLRVSPYEEFATHRTRVEFAF